MRGAYRNARTAARCALQAVLRLSPLLAVLSLVPATAAQKTRIEILPGPAVMSAEEKAIAADPASGIEHGVVLVEETEIDDDRGEYTRTSYHLRAKILSSEARDLANVVVPYNRKAGYFKTWWGRTILPDGTALDLPESALEEQPLVKGTFGEVKVMKGALPGVVPGCVIDYGYVVMTKDWQRIRRVPLQRNWPLRRFRYRWIPYSGMIGRYHVSRSDGFKVNITRDNTAILLDAENLPPAADEPWMPPAQQVRGTATLFYSGSVLHSQEFWDRYVRGVEDDIKAFLGRDRLLKEAVAALPVPPGADLDARLRAAYAWIAANVKNTSLLTAEEFEAAAEDAKRKEKDTAEFVLTVLEANTWQIDTLFIGMARALGAQAHRVLAPDRREHFWDKNLLSPSQFDYSLVAVRAPGEPLEKARPVDPGSGLLYGDVPWWITSIFGMIATPEGAREITMWPSQAQHNVSESTARVTFDGPDGSPRVSWSRQGTGQHGFLERRAMRHLGPEDRARRLDELCGASGTFEVSRADSPGLEELAAGLRLACEGGWLGGAATESEHGFPVDGPWIEPYPDFGSATRLHPVVLPFRRTDLLHLEVVSSPGFEPGTAPPAVSMDSPFGRYLLSAQRTPEGFRVERTLILTRAIIPVEDYPALRSFFERARRADDTLLHFVRSAEAR